MIGIVEWHIGLRQLASRLGAGGRCVENRRAPVLEPRARFYTKPLRIHSLECHFDS